MRNLQKMTKPITFQKTSRRSAGYGTCLVVALLLIPTRSYAGPDSPTRRDANVAAHALADRDAVVPGEEVGLAVVLKPDKDWHIYWRSPGGTSGMPTEIDWTAPPEFQFGRVQFPCPTIKHDKLLKEDSYILEGESVFLVVARVPDSLKAGEKARFTARVSFLACKLECIPGEVELSLTLPVAAPGAKPRPANEKVFKKARFSLPEPLSAAKHIKIGHRVDDESVKPGESFAAALTIDIAPKHHMQSHKPALEELIPTVLFLEPTPGFEFGELVYPKAKEREDKFLGKLSEYEGKVEIKIPVTVAEDADLAPRWIRGVLLYQICSDEGTCYPPQYIEVAFPVRMAGGPAPTDAALGDTSPAGLTIADTQAPALQSQADWFAPTQKESSDEIPKPAPNVKAGTPSPLASDVPPAGAYASSSVDEGWLNNLQNWFIKRGYYGVITLALIGGLMLNLMPCVLPVISLKILSFVRQAHESRGRVFLLGLAYCAGIMTFFGLIAWLFATTGAGWGEHFQRPVVVLMLAAVVTAFALSLFGVFTVFAPRVVYRIDEKVESKEGLTSAFLTGVLATILGTACTAPFLSAAVSAASRFPPQQGAGIFLAVGAGMALPFLIFAAKPSWLKFIPHPGPWMGTFEALMGFLLLGTVIWLLYPIRGQLGDWGLYLTLIFLLGISIAAWIKGRVLFTDTLPRKLVLHGISASMILLAWLIPFHWIDNLENLEQSHLRRIKMMAIAETIHLTGGDVGRGENSTEHAAWNPAVWDERDGHIPWVPYDPALVRKFVESGYTVFVDFTADWCVNCKANLKSSIDIADTRRIMRELNVIPFEADYTRRDPQIKEMLDHYGRAGVPLYLVFDPHEPNRPQILPELLTPGILIDALNRAGPSKTDTAASKTTDRGTLARQ